MNQVSEKDLDAALETAFKTSAEFAKWFLRRTKFSQKTAKYSWSRSDHPWGQIPIKWKNPQTGAEEEIVKESETDVLVVFESSDGSKFALHIENKKRGGKFEPLQADMYSYRAEHWLGNPKYCSYMDYQTVLVSPTEFFKRNKTDAMKFECFVPYEDISEFIPIFED